VIIVVYVENINLAIETVITEMEKKTSNSVWYDYSEQDLLYELISCILGSRVKYEISLGASIALRSKGIMNYPLAFKTKRILKEAIYNILNRPLFHSELCLNGEHYRFAHSRSDFLSETIWNIYSNNQSLLNLLNQSNSAFEARKSIIKIGKGVGPKQASMFLRNIGYSNNLAIIDSHVLRYMKLHNLLNENIKSISILKYYEMCEHQLKLIAYKYNCSLGIFDKAVWIVMRVFLKELKN